MTQGDELLWNILARAVVIICEWYATRKRERGREIEKKKTRANAAITRMTVENTA